MLFYKLLPNLYSFTLGSPIPGFSEIWEAGDTRVMLDGETQWIDWAPIPSSPV